jgi:hypothetical protein
MVALFPCLINAKNVGVNGGIPPRILTWKLEVEFRPPLAPLYICWIEGCLEPRVGLRYAKEKYRFTVLGITP